LGVITQIVRFRSRLSDDEVLATYAQRAHRYRALPGLIDKYYLRFDATGEHGAVYLWKSPEALAEFREFELARSIPDAYQVEGTPEATTATVVMQLRSSKNGAIGAVPGGQVVT
jgi:heme-degrading monooxygenase HmoA